MVESPGFSRGSVKYNIETSDLETHLLECYLFVDDYLRSNPKVADWRRSNNSDPDFTDAEVIVIAYLPDSLRKAPKNPLQRSLPDIFVPL